MAVNFVAVEAIALLEIVVTVAANSDKWTFRSNRISHELIGPNVIAANKLLNAPEQWALFLQYVVLNGRIAAGIIVATIWEEVNVSNSHSHTKTAASKR